MLRKLLTLFIFIFSFLFFVSSAYASTLYLSPGAANIPQASIVSVRVGLNTAGESINGISAYLSYPADKLEVAWISYGGSFPIAAEQSYGGGSIRISRGSITGAVGNLTIATIGFKGKAQGTANVSFIGGSAAPRTSDSSDSLNLGGSAGGVFTVGAPKPGGSTGGTPVPGVTGTGDTKQPIISGVKIENIASDGATITWTTDEKSDSTVEYGLTKNNYILGVYDKNLSTDHSLKLEGKALTPGAVMHLRVKSKDAAGNEGVSDDYGFHLKGYNITITFLDSKKKPIQNSEVLLYPSGDVSKTDLSGEAVFIDVTPGKHLAVIKLTNNFDKTEEINVEDSPLMQTFTLGVNTELGGDGTLFTYVTLAVAGFLILGIIIIIFLIRKPSASNNNPQVHT